MEQIALHLEGPSEPTLPRLFIKYQRGSATPPDRLQWSVSERQEEQEAARIRSVVAQALRSVGEY